MKTTKSLVVNADDFGFTRDVNAGIVEAHRNGILTAATIMANGAAFEDAVRLAAENPGLEIGCHLVLVQGESVLTGRPLPTTIGRLIRAVALRRLPVYEELAAQVRRVLDAGLEPTHLDTHKHTHLLPPVLDAVARISEQFRIPWVRRPFDFGACGDGVPAATRIISRCLGVAAGRFRAVLAAHGCRITDHFAGFRLTGRLGTRELRALIRSLPPGSTELMCHPGHCTDELRGARTRLKDSRETELAALIAPETRRAVEENEVRLTGYRGLDRS